MLVREMHIDFDLKCQKIDSNHYDTFLPQEKDWLLNLAQRAVIKTRSNRKSNRKQEGFFDTYKRVADLEELVVSANLPTYVYQNSGDAVFSVVPADFFGMVNHRTIAQYNCNGMVRAVKAATFKTAKVTIAESNPTPPTTPYQGFTIVLNTTSGNQTLYAVTLPFTSKEERYAIIQMAIESINRHSSGVKAYWNKFAGTINNGTMVFTSSNVTHTSITLTLHTGATPLIAAFKDAGYNSIDTASTKKEFTKASRVADNEYLYKMMDNPFHVSRQDSVLLSYEHGLIVAQQRPTFYVSNILIDYIKVPQYINLAAGHDCELSESIHEEIVDKAVQLAQAYIGAESYKTIINENLLNE